MRLSAVFPAILSAWLLAACDNPEQQANALFVEAAQAITAAQAQPDPAQQYDQLIAAKESVTRIVTDFPGSSAAVRISANEKIGPYSLADLTTAIVALAEQPELCLRSLSRACLTDMVLKNLAELLTRNTSSEPDEALMQVAFTGLPYANIVAQDRVRAVFANSPDGEQGNTMIMPENFGFPPSTPILLNMIAVTKGEKALTDAITTLKQTPNFTKQATEAIGRFAFIFLQNRTPNSAKLLKTAAAALQQPLPDKAAKELSNAICRLSTDSAKNAIILPDCTPREIVQAGTYYGHIPPEMFEKLYEAAAPEKRLDVAEYIYGADMTLDQQLAWYQRTKYGLRLSNLANLYLRSTREGHRARPPIIAQLDQAKDGTLDNPALTQAGVTPKNILLLHANGALREQLPAIYQNIAAQPRYSEQLSLTLEYLTQLQPLTPGMSQMEFFALVGKTVSIWPADYSASRDAVRRMALYQYPTDADPRPAYEALYAGAPYHTNLTFDALQRFKAHGHTDIYEKAVGASQPIEEVHSLRFTIARQEIYDLAETGNGGAVIAKLEDLPFITRYYILGHLMQTGSIAPAALDAIRGPLLPKYPYELSAYEIGWSDTDLGVPKELKLDALCANYQKVTEFTGNSPAQWFVDAFADFTPQQRMQALKAMHQARDPLWLVYASAIAIVDHAE